MTINQNTVPAWNLGDLYKSISDPNISLDLKKAEQIAKSLHDKYLGKLSSINNGDELFEIIKSFEEESMISGKLSGYADLLYSENMTNEENARFRNDLHEKLTEISNLTIFFALEVNHIEESVLQEMLKNSSKLKHYEPFLRDIRVQKDHLLSNELELLLNEKYVTGKLSWIRVFDELLAGLKFDYDGKILSCPEILGMLSSKDGEVRKKAAKAFGKVLGENIKTFGLVMNVLAKDKQIEDKWRKFKNPMSSRNLSNLIEDEVVDNLLLAVKANYANLSHRYYKMKAKIFGVEKLAYWDRNAPYPEDNDHLIEWEQAKDIVLKAYEEFSPEMAKIGKMFFDNNWIDAKIRAGKESGAFSHPLTTNTHPYILMNFQGKNRDVMTLAHELGHGVHQFLAKEQGEFISGTPLTLAETASVFGEQLVFRKLLDMEKDPKHKKFMIAAKVEDMINTVVRQIAFLEFERKVHDERAKGEVPVERICEIWLGVQAESLGSAIGFEDEYKYYWAYISHFIHAPFYVYAYAFGDCLVNSLYATYLHQPQGFVDKYIEMLKAGGKYRHQELLKPFGLNTKDPKFWQSGLDVIASFIDELEE